MKTFFNKKTRYIVIILIVIILSVSYFVKHKNSTPEWITANVDVGTVSQIISVSGTVDATKTARLAFPISGIVESINVSKGQTVKKDDLLISLKHQDLQAEYQRAVGDLTIAKANQEETLSGARPEERDIAKTKVKIAEEALEQALREQEIKVTNAYRTLLSSNLTAQPTDSDEDSTAPTITGTYTCEKGEYTLKTYRSDAESGYSYVLSGLESGTHVAYTNSAAPLGNCGLYIQFDPNSKYGNSEWTIKIPNTESSSYVTNLNAYNLAVTTKNNTIDALRQDLELAKQNETLTTANPRTEAVERNEAKVTQSQAELARIGAQIKDHILYAPFAGTVTDIKPALGETVGLEPVVTMVADDFFEINALIPEIDITKVTLGQKAELVFDAHSDEVLTATITFVSPLAETIAGVSYFETTMILDEPVNWLRGGLNADINIIVEERKNVLRLPKRFLTEEDGNYTVLVPQNNTAITIPITVDFIGNDGYAVIEGLNENDVVIAP
ncbi:MAG: HlyD family efflux transporter periplasmic adaptor subunit [Candidatus Nomurabacteria bacterium]|nr:MAG: HlyD family efflux transporter periplasmic adaptor subunit [Candidatus Nomurabacteria bacterium]